MRGSTPWYLAALLLLVAGVLSAALLHPAAGVIMVLLAASPLAVAVGARFATLERRSE